MSEIFFNERDFSPFSLKYNLNHNLNFIKKIPLKWRIKQNFLRYQNMNLVKIYQSLKHSFRKLLIFYKTNMLHFIMFNKNNNL